MRAGRARTGYAGPVLLAVLLACVQVIELEDPPPAASVGEACASGTASTVTRTVSFPAQEPGCDWGEDGNRSPEQGVVTARAEQSVALELDGLAICGLGFDFDSGDAGHDEEARLRYDDGFLLTFADAVLVASYAPLVDALAEDGLLRVYDWSRLVGFPFGFEDDGTYCLGEAEGLATCEVPPPDTSARIRLDYGALIVEALAERAHDEAAYTFGFVTYGDNDEEADCSHSAFTFTVDVLAVPF